MTKHCGLSRVFAFLVAGLFCLTLAAPQSRADQISVGTGILNLCWNGVSSPCDFPGDQPNVSFTDLNGHDQVSIHIAGNPGGDNFDLDTPLLVIFATPVENLLYPFTGDPQFNPFVGGAGNIVNVGLYEAYDPNLGPGDPPLPLPLPAPSAALTSSFPAAASVDYLGNDDDADGTDFDSQGKIYDESDYSSAGGPNNKFFDDFLDVGGIGGGADTTFDNWAKEMYDTPEYLVNNNYLDDLLAFLGLTDDEFKDGLLGDHPNPCDFEGDSSADCVTGFKIWIYEVSTSAGGFTFGSGDTINIVTDGFPLGTMVTAYGFKEDCDLDEGSGGCALVPPDSKIAILMALPELCSPTDPNCNPPEIPEPTTLLLLGTGLLAVGRQWRKKQQDRKKAEKHSVT